MFQSRISAKVEMINPQLSMIKINGEMNLYAESMLMDAFAEASHGGVQTLLLNFDKLEYMNSAGIGLLVTLLVRTRNKDQRLVACCLNAHYREIFSLTRLDEVIVVYANESEAIQALTGAGKAADQPVAVDRPGVVSQPAAIEQPGAVNQPAAKSQPASAPAERAAKSPAPKAVKRMAAGPMRGGQHAAGWRNLK